MRKQAARTTSSAPSSDKRIRLAFRVMLGEEPEIEVAVG
jgi:hypothetical protein